MQPRDELYARNRRAPAGLERDIVGVPSGVNYSRWRGDRKIFGNDSSSSDGKSSSDFSDASWSLETPRSSITSLDSDIYGNHEPLNIPRVREETGTTEVANVEIVEGVPMTGDLTGDTKIPEIEAEDIRNIPSDGLPESAHEAHSRKGHQQPSRQQQPPAPQSHRKLAPDDHSPTKPNRAELEAPAHYQPTLGPPSMQRAGELKAMSSAQKKVSSSVPHHSSPLRNEPKAEEELTTLKAGESNIPDQAPYPTVPNGLTPTSHEGHKGLFSRAKEKIEHVFDSTTHTSSPNTNGHANGATDDKIVTSGPQYPTRISSLRTDFPTSSASPIFNSPTSGPSNDSMSRNGHDGRVILPRTVDKDESAILDETTSSSDFTKSDSLSSGSDPGVFAKIKDSVEHTIIKHPDNRPDRKRKKTVSFSTTDDVITVKD